MNATTYTWANERDRATTLFNGDTPGAAIEQAIIAHFKREPAKVATLITAMGRRVANGKVHSGWAVLRAELDHVTPQLTATDSHERIKQLRIAETWLRHSGGYIDRQTELESELYDPDIGRLRHWPDTKPQILALWHEERHRFAKAEDESEKRQQDQADLRHRLAAQVSRHSPVDILQHANNIANEVERAQSIPHPDDDIPL